jgi:guanosine-3',5'-bis(diphosphate) 3'-pyrophosphohydrolase
LEAGRLAVLLAPMSTRMEIVLRAAAFAAEKHRNQRRKDEEASPYINHPIQLAYILVQADIEDPIVLAAALLHDTIEDTKTTHDEIEIVFGPEIANIVAECSDNKTLDKLERKQAQVDKAAHVSTRAKLVKLADKIANVSDIDGAPPAGWSLERKREYFDWAKRVVDRMRGVHPKLEARFDAEYAKRP